MGISTDAIVAYGWASEVEDEPEMPWEDDDNVNDYEEALAVKAGLVDPYSLYTGDPYSNEEYRAWKESVENFDELRDAWFDGKKAEVERWGCMISHHCHSDARMPYICITSTEVTCWRGSVKSLNDIVQMGPHHPYDEWNAKLRSFVDHLGIDVSELGEPGWFLVSYADF